MNNLRFYDHVQAPCLDTHGTVRHVREQCNPMESTMPRYKTDFTSTALSRGEWDSDTQSLRISFAQGREYTYENVPEHVWNALRDSSSPGAYYTTNIKNNF
jgi:hypothetical protein